MAQRKSRDLSKYLKNPVVEKVTGSNLKFTEQFKVKALKLYNEGNSANDIFLEAGIDLSDFEIQYARKSIKRWSETANQHGNKSLGEERRGARGKTRAKKFKSLSEELAYLRAENYFLKKLHALESNYPKKKNTK